MVPDGTFGTNTTDTSCSRSRAGVHTSQSLARQMPWAVVGLDTFSSSAVGQWVAFVSQGTGAHRPLSTGSAVSVEATWVGATRVERRSRGCHTLLLLFPTALMVSVATEAGWAGTTGTVIYGLTVGIESTCSTVTHTETLAPGTPVVVGAIVVTSALRLAPIDGVAVRHEVIEAAALCDP